jgi:hypothetical protein
MVDAIIAASGRDVLEVGIGTGVARQFPTAGWPALGVDVDVRMAEFALRTGLEREVAKFEEWELSGRT